MERIIRTIGLSVLMLFLQHAVLSQTVVNNGTGIVINSGAYFVIGGSYHNLTATSDGFVDNDGQMIVYRDFRNNAGNEVFTSIEAVPDGITLLPGSVGQSIEGMSSIRFENLYTSGSEKTLNNALSSVAGEFRLGSVFNLNSNVLELEKSATTALNYQSGYLYAETQPFPGLGILRWNIGTAAGTYQLPFGSGFGSYNDLNLTLRITQPAGGNGVIDFSTYPTSAANVPLPDPATSLDPYNPDVTINRFWIIDAQQAVRPAGEITFMYTDFDLQPIQESSLLAIRLNENSLTWDDRSPDGSVSVNSNTLTTSTVTSNDFFKNWTLTGTIPEDFIYVPNSFSPNGDGRNDWFYPFIGNEGGVEGYHFSIFDRWGTQLFISAETGQGWDGTYQGEVCPQDVYVYIFEYRDVLGKAEQLIGKVTLIR